MAKGTTLTQLVLPDGFNLYCMKAILWFHEYTITPYENGAVHNLKDKKRSHRTSSLQERYHPAWARVGSGG